MILPDVNVLIHAFRPGQPRHAEYRAWLEAAVNGPQAYGMSDLVLSGFLRIVTHPRAFREPDPCVRIAPGPRPALAPSPGRLSHPG